MIQRETASNQNASSTNRSLQVSNQSNCIQKVYHVNITGLEFYPSEITINQGDMIIWKNTDKTPHTVTSDSLIDSESDNDYNLEKGLYSGMIFEDGSYMHTFDEKGIYDYHCSNHPFMRARVRVK